MMTLAAFHYGLRSKRFARKTAILVRVSTMTIAYIPPKTREH